MLQHGDGRAIGVPVRKALLKLSGVILAQQVNPLTQKAPIGEAEHCLSNYRGSLQNGRQFKDLRPARQALGITLVEAGKALNVGFQKVSYAETDRLMNVRFLEEYDAWLKS